MLRYKEIQDALLHVVGWEQSFNPQGKIDDAMTQSESGLFFQSAHPLLTLDNVRAIMPDEWNYQYPKWNMIPMYHKGDVVNHNGKIYIAVFDNQNTEPQSRDFNDDFNEDFNSAWIEYNSLSAFLENLTRKGINQAIQRFMRGKELDKETRNLMERRTLVDGAGRLRNTIENRHKIVGFEIQPVRSTGVTTRIERVGLQMVGGTGIVRLYLFHSSMVEPIKTFDVNFTKANGGFQWFDLPDCYLPYISINNNSGGSWYLCYNQDELPEGMQAVNVAKDWSREPCGTCNIGSLETWREITKYIMVSPFMQHAPLTFREFPELWDIADMSYTNTTSYGLNLELSVGCDLTDFIISQRNIFANVIQLQVASTALRTLAMNPDVRVNRNQSNASRMDILYELDGNTQGRPSGLGYELEKAYKALNISTEGLDRICLACNNHGVRYRTI